MAAQDPLGVRVVIDVSEQFQSESGDPVSVLPRWVVKMQVLDPRGDSDPTGFDHAVHAGLAPAIAQLKSRLQFYVSKSLMGEHTPLDRRFAERLDIGWEPTRSDLSSAIAVRLGLPTDVPPAGQRLLAYLAVYCCTFYDEPDVGSQIESTTYAPAITRTLTTAEMNEIAVWLGVARVDVDDAIEGPDGVWWRLMEFLGFHLW
jgi:hypothetical protein